MDGLPRGVSRTEAYNTRYGVEHGVIVVTHRRGLQYLQWHYDSEQHSLGDAIVKLPLQAPVRCATIAVPFPNLELCGDVM